MSDFKLATYVFLGLVLMAIGFALCVARPGILIPLLMITLLAAPTVDFAGISVSVSDPLAAGTLLGIPLVPGVIQNIRKPVGLLAIAWVVSMALSLVAPVLLGRQEAVIDLFRLMRIASVVLPILLLGRVTLELRQLTPWLLAAGGIAIVIGLITFNTNALTGLLGKTPTQFIYLPDQVLTRATGLYGEASSFGDVAAVEILLALLAFISTKSNTYRLLTVIAAALGGVALIEAYSRSSLLFISGALLVVLLSHGSRARTAISLGSLILAAWLAVSVIQPNLFQAFLSQRVGLEVSSVADLSSGRLSNWPVILGTYIGAPATWIFGSGYKSLSDASANPLGAIPGDNNYLSALVETGILGLVTMVAFLLALGRLILQSPRSEMRTAVLALYGGILIQSLFADVFTYHRIVGLLILLTCLLPVNAVRLEGAIEKDRP